MKNSVVNPGLAQVVILLASVTYSRQQTDTSCYFQNCTVCPSEYGCTECRLGTWGFICHLQCPTGCVGNTCSKDDGYCEEGCQPGVTYGTADCPCSRCVNSECVGDNGSCLHGCRAGYYGPKCRGQCDVNCNSCTDISNNCQYCKSGYYGADCTNICSPTCSRCTDRDTCTGCKPGYYGQTCQFNCSTQCRNDKCEKDDARCTDGCDGGYYGSHCTENCGPTCSLCRDRDICIVCMTGYYGQTCQHNCPTRCRSGFCDKGGGGCTDGCADGYDDCPCPDHCQDDLCDRDGHCTVGCEDGFYGDRCSSVCSRQCLRCEGSHYPCTACEPGYYETDCSSRCSNNCLGGVCFLNGTCQDGCLDGYYGDTCSGSCYSRCSKCSTGRYGCTECNARFYGSFCQADCTTTCHDNTCDQLSGYCIKECTGQNYGVPGCPCPDNCKGTVCEAESGRCSAGCLNGYYGEKCDINCNDNCLTCSTSADNCTVCKAGYYGSDCGSVCSRNCINNTCSKTSGTCTDGCVSGYQGDECQCPDGSYMRSGLCQPCNTNCTKCTGQLSCTECTPGHYLSSGSCISCGIPGCISCTGPASCTRCLPGLAGPVCCPQHCTGGQCSPDTRYCTQGCVNGTYGEQCDRDCSTNCVACQQISGQCLQCADGYYGSRCDQHCSDGCALTNGKLVCAINDGACPNGCAVKTKHGPKCSDACSDHCVDHECDQTTARCDKGCEIGFHGNTCSQECSANCLGANCFRVNGSCSLGCVDGFTCHACLQAQSSPDDGGSSRVPAAVGGAVGILILVAVVIIVLLLRRRRRMKKTDNTSEEIDATYNNIEDIALEYQHRESPTAYPVNEGEALDTYVQVTDPDTMDYSSLEDTARSDSSPKAYDSLQFGSVAQYYNTRLVRRPVDVRDLHALTLRKERAKYKMEFESLPKGLCKPTTEAEKPGNINKNRYSDILPYDETRVILRDGDDYINASFIDGLDTPRAYIAAQGPIRNTVPDFWRLVWQEKAGKIVMLTGQQEAPATKGYQYWPEKGSSKTVGKITVTTEEEEVCAEFITRRFRVVKDGEIRHISQMQYTSWPDDGVPGDVTSLIEFRNKVESTSTKQHGPIIVHCSSGTGRTGTYIALDYLTREGEQEGSVDILGCVTRLREQRLNMVGTEEQYRFCHIAVCASLDMPHTYCNLELR